MHRQGQHRITARLLPGREPGSTGQEGLHIHSDFGFHS